MAVWGFLQAKGMGARCKGTWRGASPVDAGGPHGAGVVWAEASDNPRHLPKRLAWSGKAHAGSEGAVPEAAPADSMRHTQTGLPARRGHLTGTCFSWLQMWGPHPHFFTAWWGPDLSKRLCDS